MSNDKKPDFSNVQGDSRRTGTSNRSADFSNVQGGFRTTAEDTTPAAAQRSYTVASGDSLSRIAKAHYGKASKWR
ncbi:MAG: peptidoglycan-binding protein LysM, partial [Luteimonas sp.]